MKSIRKMNMLLGIAAICVAATSLKAQVLAGEFTLPSQTYWATTVLSAGKYTFRLDHIGMDGKIAISRGTKMVAFVLVGAISQESASDHSSMLIVEHRVRSLHLANLGLSYNFPGHRNDRELLARRAGVPGVSVIPLAMK